MAAGNHLENGIWALFVIAATIISIIWAIVVLNCWLDVIDIFRIYQCPWFRVRAIAISRRASPIRLDRAVNIPAASDFAF